MCQGDLFRISSARSIIFSFQLSSSAFSKLKCTRIVVAHRLSTVKNCDRIMVIDKGTIAEEGTYEELIAKDGIFAELVRRQRLDE